jgi:hypothetical protein
MNVAASKSKILLYYVMSCTAMNTKIQYWLFIIIFVFGRSTITSNTNRGIILCSSPGLMIHTIMLIRQTKRLLTPTSKTKIMVPEF